MNKDSNTRMQTCSNRFGIEFRTDKEIQYKITWEHNEITIIAKNMSTGKLMVGTYEAMSFNFRDGYSDEDVLEVYRLADYLGEELRK